MTLVGASNGLEFLREFLYVDTERVRAMLAQQEGGIEEQESDTRTRTKSSGLGAKGVASFGTDWGGQISVTKALGDAIFPTLESSLESAGMLVDVSEEVQDPAYWASGQMAADLPAGSLVRITSAGALFDSRYMAHIFASFATVCAGLEYVDGPPDATTQTQQQRGQQQRGQQQRGQQQRGQQQRGRSQPGRDPLLADSPQIEDQIPQISDLADPAGGRGTSDVELRALVRIARGLFTPGLHLNLVPTSNSDYIAGARLQEGRTFLDGSPDVLFARYGVDFQEWTVVGTIGHHGRSGRVAPQGANLVDEAGSVRRGHTLQIVNEFLGYLGGIGFADMPQPPGFSIVPLAVYRYITRPVLNERRPE